MNTKLIHIAIIDDGINEERYVTGQLLYNLEVTQELLIKERVGYDTFLPSHGTTCAAIIKSYLPNACLSSVKVLNEQNGKGMKKQLIKALEWCADNGVNLVNVSLGTIDSRDFTEIKEVVNNVYKRGLIIVAACNNLNIFSCPASLTNVIGVKCIAGVKMNEGQYIYNYYATDGIDITAYGEHNIVNYLGEGKKTFQCNSFAAPYITSKVHDIMMNHPGITLEAIKEKLRENAANSHEAKYIPNLCKNMDWVEKALVFLLGDKKIVNLPYIFDVKDVININCSDLASGFDRLRDYFINNSPDIADVDTVVIANTNDYRHDGYEVSQFITEMNNHGKNVICIDNYWQEKDLEFKVKNPVRKIWHPAISRYLPESTNCEEIDVPVIVLYNFTQNGIEMILHSLVKHFREDGYNPLAASDSVFGTLVGIKYIPSSFSGNKDTVMGIKNTYKVFDPDIILYSLNANDNFFEGKDQFGDRLIVDIKVLITDDTSNRNYKVSVTNDSSKITNLNFVFDNSNDYVDNESINQLYNCILELFENDIQIY